MTRRQLVRRCSTLVCALTLGALTVAQEGCYRRVVGARGLGASQYEIQQPYQESGEVDNWLFGPKEEPRRGGGAGM